MRMPQPYDFIYGQAATMPSCAACVLQHYSMKYAHYCREGKHDQKYRERHAAQKVAAAYHCSPPALKVPPGGI